GHLADCHLAIGKLEAAADEYQAAISSFAQARAILEPLAASHPQVATYQASLAECYEETGMAQAQLHSPDQGLGMLERAKAIQQRLLERSPGNVGYRKKLAEIINALGFTYFKRLDYAAALLSFQEVVRICRALIEEITVGPKPVRLLDLLALGYYNIASIELQGNHLEAALRSSERSLEYRSALVAAHPSVTNFQENLGRSLGEIARLQHA